MIMKISTRAIVGSLIAAGAVLQDPTVANMLVALTVTHPHIVAIASVIVVVAAVLHRPDIQAVIEDAPKKEDFE